MTESDESPAPTLAQELAAIRQLLARVERHLVVVDGCPEAAPAVAPEATAEGDPAPDAARELAALRRKVRSAEVNAWVAARDMQALVYGPLTQPAAHRPRHVFGDDAAVLVFEPCPEASSVRVTQYFGQKVNASYCVVPLDVMYKKTVPLAVRECAEFALQGASGAQGVGSLSSSSSAGTSGGTV